MTTWTSPFKEVCELERPVRSVSDLLTGIGLIASTIDDDQANAIGAIVTIAGHQMKEIERLRGELFYLVHPRRDEIAAEKAQRMTGGGNG